MNKNPIKWSVAALALLALIVLAWPGTAPVSGLRLSSFDSPISPIATPVIPPPPTPAPSAEAQAALVFLAQREGIALENLTLVNEFRRDSALLGRTFQAVTVFDAEGRRFFHVLVDRQSGQVEDVTAIEAAEEQVHQATYGKLQPALYERLQTMSDDETVTVTIWAAAGPGQSLPEREVAAIAALAAKYPAARAAVERGGKPMDVDDPVLAERIYQEYVELVEGGAAQRVQPLVEALAAQGITIQTSEGLPAVTAPLAKRDILLLAQRGDVGAIYLADGGHLQLLVDPATPTDQIASVGNSLQRLAGLASLGALLALGLVIVRQVVKKSEHSKNRIKRSVRIVGGLLGLLVLVLIVSRPYEQELPFETIEQGGTQGDFGVTAYKEEKPALLIIAKTEEIDNLLKGTLAENSALADHLHTLDYNRVFAALVLRGYIGSSGYSITVLQVTRQANQVMVRVRFDSPESDTIILPAFTSPYHLVAISKEGTWGEQIRFVLIDGDQPVAETTHFIP